MNQCGHACSIGAGYVGRRWLASLAARGWEVSGTTRSRDKADALLREGISTYRLDNVPWAELTHLLITAAPDEAGDAVYRAAHKIIAASPHIEWIGYLSTTGVYGDHKGAWVDEATPLQPESARSMARVMAESQWLSLGAHVKIFRLGGIYGEGRNILEQLHAGTARRILKDGQYFSRIHIEDIVRILHASMRAPASGAVFNVCDDLPASASDVVEYGAKLLGMEPPRAERYGDAALSPMLASFYEANRRVDNSKIKRELGIELAYPTYKHGLRAILGVD